MSISKEVNNANQVTIIEDGEKANITVGGNAETGTIVLKNKFEKEIVTIGTTGAVGLLGGPGVLQEVIGSAGIVCIKGGQGQETIRLHGGVAGISTGGSGQNGVLHLADQNGKATIELSAESAQISAGGPGKTGTLVLQDGNGKQLIRLGIGANITAGGNGADGDVFLVPANVGSWPQNATIHLDAGHAHVALGGHGLGGGLTLFPSGEPKNDAADKASIHLDGQHGNVWLGGKGVRGAVMLFAQDESDNHNSDKAGIHIDGDAGDIILRNADCAEEFDIAGDIAIEPGTVMVIGDDGRMRPSSHWYDRKVAGVVSGAGMLRPGIVLGRQPGASERLPIALTGKVFCRVEASEEPVRTGDLLTTSSIAGYAMRAIEPARAFGAVIGKALAPLA